MAQFSSQLEDPSGAESRHPDSPTPAFDFDVSVFVRASLGTKLVLLLLLLRRLLTDVRFIVGSDHDLKILNLGRFGMMIVVLGSISYALVSWWWVQEVRYLVAVWVLGIHQKTCVGTFEGPGSSSSGAVVLEKHKTLKSVGNMSIDSTVSMPATIGKRSFNRFA